MTAEKLADDLLVMLQDVEKHSPTITTIANGKPNRIAGVVPDGVWIETERAETMGTGPQLVPAWMINAAWDHLRSTGSLENRHLLATDGLNVKRSSAVCALLARLPGVAVTSTRPIVLSLAAPRPRST